MRLRNLSNSKDAIRILYQPASNGETDPYDEVLVERCPRNCESLAPPLSPAPTIEDDADICGDICDDSELDIKVVLLSARTDVDLTNHSNFDKIHTNRTDGNAIEYKRVHPLAHMCA